MAKHRKMRPGKEVALRRPGRPRKFQHCPAWRKVIFAEIQRSPPLAAASAPYRRRAERIAMLWIDANSIDPRFYSPRTNSSDGETGHED